MVAGSVGASSRAVPQSGHDIKLGEVDAVGVVERLLATREACRLLVVLHLHAADRAGMRSVLEEDYVYVEI
jgi:hypothetical protein